MKFPHSLLPFTLLLSLQLVFVYSQASIIGKWADPSIINNFNPVCCAPDGLTIQATTSPDTLLATYQYDNDHKLGYTDHCYDLFGSVSPAKMELKRKGTSDSFEAQKTYGADSKTITFYYQIKTGTMLTISTPVTDNFADNCEITMFHPKSKGIL